MRIIILLFILASVSYVHAQGNRWAVTSIPDSLAKNASVVIREDATIFKILAKNHAVQKVRFVVTIMNSKGNDYASFGVRYSKLVKVNSFGGELYDASGKLIRKLKNNEIKDQSEYQQAGFSDNRFKNADLTYSSYPYTVAFEYESEYKYLYDIPDNGLASSPEVTTEHFLFQLIYPPELTPRYKTMGIDLNPEIAPVAGGLESMTWRIDNFKPGERERYSRASEFARHIMVAPTEFEYEGYAGDMSSWESYGKWISSLNAGRDELPAATKAKVRELTANLSDDRSKAKVLYEYMQGKTRYVNISLGIGSLQPFPAATVDQNGYGDCKALSNYMVALLKEAGIKSYYATIMAGEQAWEVETDFPSHQANHAIVAIPSAKDTIWLECTSQTNPFGYLGEFTDDRMALLVTENGGVLVRTTRYGEEVNTQIRKAEIQLTASGNGKGKVVTCYSGLQYENGELSHVLNSQYDLQKKWVLDNIQIPSFEVVRFDLQNKKDLIPSATVSLDLTLNRLASVNGKRMFLVPNLMNRSTFVPEKNDNRKTPIVVSTGYRDVDTVRYTIPENLYPEFLPEPVTIESAFGQYKSSLIMDQGSVIYIREIIVHEGTFQPERYPEFVNFYRSVNKADQTKIVFLSKT